MERCGDLSLIMTSGEVGDMMFVWIAVLFILILLTQI